MQILETNEIKFRVLNEEQKKMSDQVLQKTDKTEEIHLIHRNTDFLFLNNKTETFVFKLVLDEKNELHLALTGIYKDNALDFLGETKEALALFYNRREKVVVFSFEENGSVIFKESMSIEEEVVDYCPESEELFSVDKKGFFFRYKVSSSARSVALVEKSEVVCNTAAKRWDVLWKETATSLLTYNKNKKNFCRVPISVFCSEGKFDSLFRLFDNLYLTTVQTKESVHCFLFHKGAAILLETLSLTTLSEGGTSRPTFSVCREAGLFFLYSETLEKLRTFKVEQTSSKEVVELDLDNEGNNNLELPLTEEYELQKLEHFSVGSSSDENRHFVCVTDKNIIYIGNLKIHTAFLEKQRSTKNGANTNTCWVAEEQKGLTLVFETLASSKVRLNSLFDSVNRKTTTALESLVARTEKFADKSALRKVLQNFQLVSERLQQKTTALRTPAFLCKNKVKLTNCIILLVILRLHQAFSVFKHRVLKLSQLFASMNKSRAFLCASIEKVQTFEAANTVSELNTEHAKHVVLKEKEFAAKKEELFRVLQEKLLLFDKAKNSTSELVMPEEVPLVRSVQETVVPPGLVTHVSGSLSEAFGNKNNFPVFDQQPVETAPFFTPAAAPVQKGNFAEFSFSTGNENTDNSFFGNKTNEWPENKLNFGNGTFRK